MRHRIEGIIRKANIINPIDRRMISQKLCNVARILHVALDAESHGLNSLQKQETVEGRQRGSSISLTDCATARDKGRVTKMVDVDDAVVCDLRLVQHVKLLGILPPGKLAAIHNHPANAGATAPNEFRHRVEDDVSAILDRS